MYNPEFSYTEYLSAKKSIDDRSLNFAVAETMKKQMMQINEGRIHVTEFGAGIGTMIERFIEWDFLKVCNYTCIEKNPSFIEAALHRLQKYATDNTMNYKLYETNDSSIRMSLENASAEYSIQWINSDFYELMLQRCQLPNQDLVIAHSFLDMFFLPDAVAHIFSFLKSDGWFYFTMNYDGITRFLPHTHPEIDTYIETLYNNSMDRLTDHGHSRSGSQSGSLLFQAIPDAGGEILESGSSDWVLFPHHGEYTSDEYYFIQSILQTANKALSKDGSLPPGELKAWIQRKFTQLEEAQLVFQAHQLDFTGRKM